MSALDMLRPGPGGPLPPPPGMTPGPAPGMMPGGIGDGGPAPPIPDQLRQLMDILGVSPGEGAGQEIDPEEMQMSPVEHIQAAMMHLMMAFTQEGDESKGMGLMKGMGALQGLLAGAQKEQAAAQPPPALGG